MISWFFPDNKDDSSTVTNEQVAEALLALVNALDSDAEELWSIVETYSEVLLSRLALAVLYLTLIREMLEKHEQNDDYLSFCLYFVRYAQIYGFSQAFDCLSSSAEEAEVYMLFPVTAADWLEPLSWVRDILNKDEYPLVFASLCAELGDFQAQTFDEVQDEHLLEQAYENYTSALPLVAGLDNPRFRAYLYMRRGISSFYRHGGERADHLERAIVDFEAALSFITCENELELWVTINKHLGAAYTERIYDQKTKNLHRAVAAYTAALIEPVREQNPREYRDIQLLLASLFIQLKQEEEARAAFAAVREATRHIAQLSIEEEAGNPARQSPAPESVDLAVVASTVDTLVIQPGLEQLHTFLEQHAPILLSRDALNLLRWKLDEIAETDQTGYSEHLVMLLSFIEQAQEHSIAVAWERYLIEILPALEEALLLAIAPSFQEVERRIYARLEVFSSPAMIAMLYMISLANSGDGEEEFRQEIPTIRILKQLHALGQPPQHVTQSPRAEQKPASSPVQAEGTEEDEKPGFISPADVAAFNFNDPFFKLISQEFSRLLPEQMALLFPLFAQMRNILDTRNFTDFSRMAQGFLEQLDPQKTPYIWALIHWISVGNVLNNPQENPDEVLAHCEAALSVISRETVPVAWANLVLLRGIIQMDSIVTDTARRLSPEERERYIEQALADFNAVEAYYASAQSTYEHALVLATRGMALMELENLQGQSRYSSEQLIADFDAAVPAITRQGIAWQRMCLHIYRARALHRYAGGDRRANLERVIDDCNTVIQLSQARTSRIIAEFWAHGLAVRGNAYLERIAGGKRENIEQAIKDFDMALTVYTRSSAAQDWAITLAARGSAYMQRVEGDRLQNLAQSLTDYSDALAVLRESGDAFTAAQVLLNRSSCYQQRMAVNPARNQALALEDCNESLALFTRLERPLARAMALANRAAISMQILSGDRRRNFLQAQADCHEALKIFSPGETPLEWARVHVNLGTIQRSLAMLTGFTQRSAGIRTMMRRLFNHHVESIPSILGEINSGFEQALQSFSAALTVFSRESTPLEWATTLRERAITYGMQTRGYFTGERESNLRKGIFDYDAALSVFSRHETPQDWAIAISNRGILYSELASSENLVDAEKALADMQEAATVFTPEIAPASFCRIQHIRAGVLAKLARWMEAHEALSAIRAAQRNLTSTSSASQEQMDIIAEFALIDIYVMDAWAILHIEPIDDEAVAIALEEGRARSLRAALDLDTLKPESITNPEARKRLEQLLAARNQWRKAQHQAIQNPANPERQKSVHQAFLAFAQARKLIRELDNPDFMTPAPRLENIARAISAPDEAIVYLVPGSILTETGGMALMVTLDADGKACPRHMLLPDLQEMALFDLMEVEGGATPVLRIAEAVTTLGKMGLDVVVEQLLSNGIRNVRLVPYGWLGLFPLPSVLVSVQGGRQRNMSDLFDEVTLIPSARALEVVRERSSTPQSRRPTLLIAGNPTPQPPEVQALPYAEAEADAIRRVAKRHGYASANIRYLLPGEITRERVIEELRQAGYAHLSLHAEYVVEDPRRSRLLLAGAAHIPEQERTIYLGEALDNEIISLKELRLLVLSACETSIIDMQRVPNEVLGFSAGFLQAGAVAVIASLWPVDDSATYLLMTRFASFYLDPQGLWSPARALAEAQRWMREEATNRVLAEYDPVKHGSSILRSLRLSHTGAMYAMRRRAADEDPDALPFADPFYWGGFVVTGM